MEPETLEEISKALEEIYKEMVVLVGKQSTIKMKYLRKREQFVSLYSKAQRLDPTIPDLPRLPE